MHEIERLLKGFERFQQHYFEDEPELFDTLRDGQRPPTLLIGCSDSRVDPALLLGCDPGELFTVRNIGNLVRRAPAATKAACMAYPPPSSSRWSSCAWPASS